MADQYPGVNAAFPAQGVHVSCNALPGKVDAVAHSRQRNVFPVGEELHIPIVVSGAGRGQHLAALPNNYGGVAILRRGAAQGVVQGLGVVVGVVVDKSGGHNPAIGVNYPGRGLVEFAHTDYLPVLYSHVGVIGWATSPVNHPAVLDE